MKKSIYSLVPLKDIVSRSNGRYLECISTLDDNRVGSVNLNKISKNVTEKNHVYKGFNFFNDDDQLLLLESHEIFCFVCFLLNNNEMYE